MKRAISLTNRGAALEATESASRLSKHSTSIADKQLLNPQRMSVVSVERDR